MTKNGNKNNQNLERRKGKKNKGIRKYTHTLKKKKKDKEGKLETTPQLTVLNYWPRVAISPLFPSDSLKAEGSLAGGNNARDATEEERR